ncbi:hypothetical protein RR48_10112 [Papilio machaon]|uniref:Uncharacterized protein n=1 Tax=Papilio machaon TaxID=76193 RepID=A0A194QZQ1_PAPMA|nr:hypothetical protein RR48_10112 [Papilio machaon]
MIEKVLPLIAIISTANSQLYPVTIPCSQGGISPVALQPVYAKVRAAPPPSLAVPPSVLAPIPRGVLPNTNIVLPKQQLVCPVEYSIIGPSLSTLPLPTPTISEPCHTPLSIPTYPEYILTDYTNDLCVPEPVFDILGCLDPILTRYGTISEVLIPEIPQNPLISPFLPAASPVSSLAPPIAAINTEGLILRNVNNLSPNKPYNGQAIASQNAPQYNILSIPKRMIYSGQTNRMTRRSNSNDLLANKLRLSALQNVLAATETRKAGKQINLRNIRFQ